MHASRIGVLATSGEARTTTGFRSYTRKPRCQAPRCHSPESGATPLGQNSPVRRSVASFFCRALLTYSSQSVNHVPCVGNGSEPRGGWVVQHALRTPWMTLWLTGKSKSSFSGKEPSKERLRPFSMKNTSFSANNSGGSSGSPQMPCSR
jgi:hypothetical protein